MYIYIYIYQVNNDCDYLKKECSMDGYLIPAEQNTYIFLFKKHEMEMNTARGVIVIVAGIGHGDTSSNPGLIAFHIALIPLEKVWIQLFSLHLWVNSRTV